MRTATLIALLIVPVGLEASGVRGQAAVTGAARLAGVVVTTDAASVPVRRAFVTLTDSALGTRSEMTDAEGRFVFENVRPQRYTLSASRAGFVTALYGAKRPGRPGTILSIREGDSIEGLTLHMARGAAVTGRVRDQSGDPAPGVQIVVLRVGQDVDPRTSMSGPRQILTDDRGMYRAFGLAPGDYHVAAIPRLSGTGGVTLMTTAETDAMLKTLQQRPPRAASGVAPSSPPRQPSRNQGHMFAPVYYPGTAVRVDARTISLGPGDEWSAADIQLMLVPVASIQGMVTHADGTPAANAQLMIAGGGSPRPLSFAAAPILNASPGAANGHFSYTNVTPGRYTITARLSGADPQFSTVDVTVDGSTVSGVTLVLQRGLIFSGRVQFDAAAMRPPEDLRQVRISVQPPPALGFSAALNQTVFGLRFPASGTASPDGTFEVKNIIPGAYQISATVPRGTSGREWWLRSAMAGGRDLLDLPLTVTSDLTDAVLTFTDKHTELSGVLQTPAGQPAVEFFVVVAPADRRFWFPESRRVKWARPATDGRFAFANLPAGEYLVAALADLDPAEISDVSFLEQLSVAAVKVTMPEGGQVRQDLRIAR